MHELEMENGENEMCPLIRIKGRTIEAQMYDTLGDGAQRLVRISTSVIARRWNRRGFKNIDGNAVLGVVDNCRESAFLQRV